MYDYLYTSRRNSIKLVVIFENKEKLYCTDLAICCLLLNLSLPVQLRFKCLDIKFWQAGFEKQGRNIHYNVIQFLIVILKIAFMQIIMSFQ